MKKLSIIFLIYLFFTTTSYSMPYWARKFKNLAGNECVEDRNNIILCLGDEVDYVSKNAHLRKVYITKVYLNEKGEGFANWFTTYDEKSGGIMTPFKKFKKSSMVLED